MAAWIYSAVWKNLFFPDDACIWYFPARKKLRQLIEKEDFDVLITVSLPFTGHLLGLDSRSKGTANKRIFWIADIGDPFSLQAKSPNNRFLYQKKNRRLERQILETADAVTVTTIATLHKYREQFGEKAVAKMAIIPPLLSVIPASIASPGHRPSSTIHRPPSTVQIGYFGALYAPTRTPDAWLDLLRRTIALRPDLRERLEIHFYGEIFPEFYDRLSAEPNIQLHGLCSREAAWAAMQQMDILLNIGNATDFQLPSKAVEYLAAGKPVLNLSYVENDPFKAFFGETAQILTLQVNNGQLSDDALKCWLDWLESDKGPLDQTEINQQITPFLVENIAIKYRSLISLVSPQ